VKARADGVLDARGGLRDDGVRESEAQLYTLNVGVPCAARRGFSRHGARMAIRGAYFARSRRGAAISRDRSRDVANSHP